MTLPKAGNVVFTLRLEWEEAAWHTLLLQKF